MEFGLQPRDLLCFGEVRKQAEGPEAARLARLDRQHDLLERLRCAMPPSVLTAAASLAILARLCRLVQTDVRDDELLHAGRGVGGGVPNLADRLDSLLRRGRTVAVRLGQRARDGNRALLCAASFAASMVHSFANSRAFLIASASRLPAVAPLTIEAVMPSMPPEAARADLVAAASMLDRFALTDLMDWFALSTSTVTTSSIWLLFAMRVRPLAVQLVPFFVQDQHRVELISPDIVQADVDAQVESRSQVEGAPDEQAGFGGLRGVELVLGAVVATTASWRVRTQAGIA